MATTQISKTVSARILEDNTQVFIESFSNITTIAEYVDKQILLTTGTVDQAVDISPVTTAQEVYLETEQQISVKLNGIGNPAYIIKDIWYLSTDSITSIHLSNSSGTNSRVKIIIA